MDNESLAGLFFKMVSYRRTKSQERKNKMSAYYGMLCHLHRHLDVSLNSICNLDVSEANSAQKPGFLRQAYQSVAQLEERE